MGSSVKTDHEQAGYGATAQLTGHHRQVIGDAVATRTLTAKESGALCLFDRAAGVIYTLPAPKIGMFFEFQTTVTITSGSSKVITDAATTSILGIVDMMIAGAATTLAAAGNGSTHVSILGNGSTTGGVIGDRYRLTAISATQWAIDGQLSATGVLATPFSTN